MRIRTPIFGETRIRKGFLLFPITITESPKETRWLEFAKWEERYSTRFKNSRPENYWRPVRWIDEETK